MSIPSARRALRPPRIPMLTRQPTRNCRLLRLDTLDERCLPSTYTVNSTADSGAGTLRQALLNANSNAGQDSIAFQFSGSGLHTIQPLSALPTITESVILDGTTQTGYSGKPIIELDGTSAGDGTSGLWSIASNCTIKGLVVNRFDGYGVVLQGADNCVVQGNYIGTDSTGTLARGNGNIGLLLFGGAGSNQLTQNVISGNNVNIGTPGVYLADSGTDSNVLSGNLIGTDATGTAALGNSGVGLFIVNQAKSNRIGTNGDGINDAAERNVISANAYQGIAVGNAGADLNVVAGNYIGTDITGTSALPNGGNGVLIYGGAASNRIGARGSDVNAAAEGNLISGNSGCGVWITDSGSNQNVVAGNFIGTNGAGSLAVPNGDTGVVIVNGAQSYRVGTDADGANDAAERNVVSGNLGHGIYIANANTAQNVVTGNYVGTDKTGLAALGNHAVGVYINGAPANRIGTNGDGSRDVVERNVIAANAYQGVAIGGLGADQNVVAGNFIGTDVNGTVARGNGNNGVYLFGGGQSNRVGVSAANFGAANEGNVISGNAHSGVAITDAGTDQNIVAGNFIGTDAAGAQPLGEQVTGILITNGAKNNRIGIRSGDANIAGEANLITGSRYVGVAVTGIDTTGNAIRGNSIFGNDGIGIDVAWDAISINDTADGDAGPNSLQNYPIIQSASPGASTSVAGRLNAMSGASYTLDFYASSSPNLSFFGDGQTYLGSTTVMTNAAGNATFSTTLAATTSATQWLTATATDAAGNTSEFSAAVRLPWQSIVRSATSWVSAGPAPVGVGWDENMTVAGRVNVAAADPTNPNVMYIGSDNGGVWKTTDWLSPSPSWIPVTDNQPGLATASIGIGEHDLVVYPGNPSIVYAAVGGAGGGILKSTDAGATWNLLANSTFQWTDFGAVVVSPTDPNLLYAANNTGVYKSTNGGVDWTLKFIASATDLVMDPTNPNVLYAGLNGTGGFTNGVYKSTNGGDTWVLLNNGVGNGATAGFICLAIAPSAPLNVYATIFDPSQADSDFPYGQPMRYGTANGGMSWTALGSLGGNEYRTWHVLLAVDPANPQTVFANGAYSIFRSTDAGVNWTDLDSDYDHVGAAFDSAGGLAMVSDQGVHRWPGPGFEVENKQGNLQITELYDVSLDPLNPDVAYATSQDHYRALKLDGGPVWNYLTSGSEWGKLLVDPVTAGRVFMVDWFRSYDGVQDVLRRSDDGGASWVVKQLGLPTGKTDYSTASMRAFQMDPANRHRLVLGTTQVFETTDDADNWSAISPVLSPNGSASGGYFITSLALAASDNQTIYASTQDGKQFVTADCGSTWLERDLGLPVASAGAICIDPLDAQRAFVALGFGGVWMTANAGLSWTNVTGDLPTDLAVNALAVDWRFATPRLYAGTQHGVFASTNGANWARFGLGMPNTHVSELEFLPQFDILAAATYGRGVLEILLPGPVDIGQSDVSVSPSNLQSGGTATATLSTRDAAGNLAIANGLSVAFVLGGGTATGTFGSVTNHGDGTYTATFTAGAAGTNTISATINAIPVTSTPADITVDNTPPTTGTVNDGVAADIDEQRSTTTITANWSGFGDSGSGIASYEWAIGTTPGGTDVRDFANVGSSNSASATGLNLSVGSTNYVSVRATDLAGNVSTPATSDGLLVLPTPSIIITPTSGLTSTELGGVATFTVVLNVVPTDDVMLSLASSNTTLGTLDKASLTFTPGNALTPQVVTIIGHDDGVNDGNHAYTIITAPANSSDLDYNGLDAADPSVTSVGFLPKKVVTLTDQDGDVYTIRQNGPGRLGVLLSDADSNSKGPLDRVIVHGTDSARSTLTLAVKKPSVGDGRVSIGSIDGTGLKAITASASDLVGAGITLSGTLGSLNVRDVKSGVTVHTGGTALGKTRVVVHLVEPGAAFNFGTSVSSFRAAAMLGGSLTTPSLGKLSVPGDAKNKVNGVLTPIRGDFNADLTLTGTGDPKKPTALSSVVISGNLTSGSWNIGGKAGAIKVKGSVSGWQVNGIAGIRSLNLGDVTSATISAGGPIVSVRTKKWDAGSLVASSIGSLSVGGNLGADMTLSGAGVAAGLPVLIAANVTGTVSGSTIMVAGPVNSFTAGGFVDSSLLVGFTPTNALDPFAGGAFAAGVKLNTFRVTGEFGNSVVAAPNLGTATLKTLTPNNAGDKFGLLVDTKLDRLTITTPVLTLKNVTADPTLLPEFGDFEVRIR